MYSMNIFRTVSVSSEDEDDSLLRELNQELETADETDGGEDLPVDKRQSQQNQNQVRIEIPNLLSKF